jgi:hypothetical protein
MSTETVKWQIPSFCCVLMLRYSFMGYATLTIPVPSLGKNALTRLKKQYRIEYYA